MLLRTLREHGKTHNWFAVGVDLLVLIVGVFIGMQATNWNDARLARNEGRQYLERIVADMRADQVDMGRRLAYYAQVREYGVAALAALEGSRPMPDEAFLFAVYESTQIVPRPINRSTYDEAVAGGGFAQIGSSETRALIANYYLNREAADVTIRNVPPYRDIARRYMPLHVQELIRERCPEVRIRDARGDNINVLPTTCELGLSANEAAAAVSQVRSAPELHLDLTRYISDIDQKLILFNAERESATHVIGELSRR
jgi:hypothetical protein